jgi:hypothetical protein
MITCVSPKLSIEESFPLSKELNRAIPSFCREKRIFLPISAQSRFREFPAFQINKSFADFSPKPKPAINGNQNPRHFAEFGPNVTSYC